ncbi:MAG: TniB family NTP-binding protein [Thiotrichales bacterium]|jgi:hypothetical protein|nr:TniB family NTP-binding protein [Thiotrichales bacterium]
MEHLHESTLSIMGCSDSERISYLYEPRWVSYERAENILALLQELLNRPKKPRLENLLLIGDSNSGKTTLINKFYKDNPYKILNGFTAADIGAKVVRPVILCDAPSKPDEKALYGAILEKLGAPFRATDITAKLHHQLVALMRQLEVKMLIIDEIHNVLIGTPVKQRELMNVIKNLTNNLNIPIIGVGTIDAVQVLHTDPQHASRFDVVELPRWDIDKAYLRLLMSFESILPLRKPSGLHHKEIAMKLLAISRGNLGDLHRLLIECARDAIQSKVEQITPEIIEKHKWVQPTQGIRKRL